jgi:superfamily II DNA or RNA helicase/SAM-dependent methyltransferase
LLARLGVLVANCDEETADYLAASAVRALWDKAYEIDRLERSGGDPAAIAALRADLDIDPPDDVFARTIWERFTDEYTEARSLIVPNDWAFTPVPGSPVTDPNLMQRHVATVVRDRRRYGNWSGTGAGKTVSAVLASRLVGAGRDGIVPVVCPNNVVPVWARVVTNCFRDARVATKTLTPDFGPGNGERWLIVNYDILPGRGGAVSRLVEHLGVDMLIIDEVHYVKHRENHDMSQRRQVLRGLAADARAVRPDLAVLAMSATPVVNDLHEARSLLELVEGENLDDVGVSATVNDAMSIHQRIVRSGTRWMPSYAAALDVVTPRLDIGHLAEDLRALGRTASPLAVEQILVDAKTDTIIEQCLATKARGQRTLVYSQFVDGIATPLARRLRDAGLSVGMFTGEDKDGLARLIGLTPAGEAVTDANRIDVLIGSDAVGTGVDGLQHVCDTLIFATLPWTHANYMQVVGRVHRQGQQAARVTVVIPSTFIDIDTGAEVETWSWDDKAWARIQNKRTLADCAVDGVVPDREMVTPGQAVRAHLRWLARLLEGDYRTAQRAPLDDGLGADVERMGTGDRSARYGDLSRMNGVWGSTHSQVVHRRLGEDPTEWHRYHALYRAARLTWDVVPALRFAEWLASRPAGQRVADLGCGEMLLTDAVGGRHIVDAYDHVAVDERVTVCDIAQVPAPDSSYDYAVLSLALMGANHVDYVREAHRILRTDGYLWLAEPTSHLGTDEAALRGRLADLAFDVTTVGVYGQFTFVRATKGERIPSSDPTARVKETRDALRAMGVAVRSQHPTTSSTATTATDGSPCSAHRTAETGGTR